MPDGVDIAVNCVQAPESQPAVDHLRRVSESDQLRTRNDAAMFPVEPSDLTVLGALTSRRPVPLSRPRYRSIRSSPVASTA